MAVISNATTIADAGAFSVNLGSMVLIKTLTASSSGTLSFVNGASGVVLDNTYSTYIFKFINCHPATNTAKRKNSNEPKDCFWYWYARQSIIPSRARHFYGDSSPELRHEPHFMVAYFLYT